MKKNELVSKIASTSLLTVHTAQKMSEVRKLFKEKKIHHLPVVSGDKLVGLISATDMVALSFSAYAADERSVDAVLDSQFSIEEVMQKGITTLHHSDSIKKAAEILAEGRFHSLPIVDDNNELKGIVTSTDLISYLLAQY